MPMVVTTTRPRNGKCWRPRGWSHGIQQRTPSPPRSERSRTGECSGGSRWSSWCRCKARCGWDTSATTTYGSRGSRWRRRVMMHWHLSMAVTMCVSLRCRRHRALLLLMIMRRRTNSVLTAYTLVSTTSIRRSRRRKRVFPLRTIRHRRRIIPSALIGAGASGSGDFILLRHIIQRMSRVRRLMVRRRRRVLVRLAVVVISAGVRLLLVTAGLGGYRRAMPLVSVTAELLLL